jgi:hypothetical protein
LQSRRPPGYSGTPPCTSEAYSTATSSASSLAVSGYYPCHSGIAPKIRRNCDSDERGVDPGNRRDALGLTAALQAVSWLARTDPVSSSWLCFSVASTRCRFVPPGQQERFSAQEAPLGYPLVDYCSGNRQASSRPETSLKAVGDDVPLAPESLKYRCWPCRPFSGGGPEEGGEVRISSASRRLPAGRHR